MFIPSDISAFQQQQQQQQHQQLQQQQQRVNHPGLSSHASFGGTSSLPWYAHNHSASHGLSYPNATLLKSPRLFKSLYSSFDQQQQLHQQYTPPPMLSPFRKGPGLFYNQKRVNLLLLPFLNSQQQRNSQFYSYPSTSDFNSEYPHQVQLQHQSCNKEDEEYLDVVHNYDDDEAIKEKPASEIAVEAAATSSSFNLEKDKEQEKTAITLDKNSLATTSEEVLPSISGWSNKPSLMRTRLLSQISSSNGNGAFFPDESANDAITAALIDAADLASTTTP